MSKRGETLETVSIALALLRRIPKGRYITSTELFNEISNDPDVVEREPRTLQRLMEKIAIRYELDRDESTKPYKYRWKDNAKGLHLPGLTLHESLLLTLARQHLGNLLPYALKESLEGFFKQAQECMNDPQKAKKTGGWLDKVCIVNTTQPLLPAKINQQVFDEVTKALYQDLMLDVRYINSEQLLKGGIAAGRKPYEARILPLGLAQQGTRMYLVCRYEGHDDERHLALHRIQWAQSTNFHFERPANFDLKKHIADGRFGYGNGQKIRLTFRIRKGAGLHIVESPLSEDQTVEEVNDEYEIRATLVDTEVLDSWLRSFGDDISFASKEKIGGPQSTAL